MTAKEMKIKAFSLIEEYYPGQTLLAEDEDVLNKINGVINQIQMELMQYRKINASIEIEVTESDDHEFDLINYMSDYYQISQIRFDDDTEYSIYNDTIISLPENYVGTFTVYYYKYPEMMRLTFNNSTEAANYDKRFEFELDPILLEVMPYGIAADLLKMDMISNYGRYFAERYNEMKNALDSRKSSGRIVISGGVDI